MGDADVLLYGGDVVDVVGVGWIGCDLDGTLAIYDVWRGEDHIGDPIPLTVQLVKDILARGVEVRIVTARYINGAHQIEVIEQWCERHIGRRLKVTASKDFGMLCLIDDRCVTVETNTGIILTKGGRALIGCKSR